MERTPLLYTNLNTYVNIEEKMSCREYSVLKQNNAGENDSTPV